MKKEDVIADCRSLFNGVTPLDFDCGKLCGGKCCRGDEDTGMLIFPGEEKLLEGEFEIRRGSFSIAVCSGTCRRSKRPLACMIYPLFPLAVKDENGGITVKVVRDIRAHCPINDSGTEVKKRFARAVKRTGEYLLLNDETKKFLLEISNELTEIENLYKKWK